MTISFLLNHAEPAIAYYIFTTRKYIRETIMTGVHFIRTVLLRNKSRLYAALGTVVPVLVALKITEAPTELVTAVCILGSLVFVLFIPNYAIFMISAEDRINLSFASVTLGRITRTLLYVPLLSFAFLPFPLGVQDEPGHVALFIVMLGASNGLHSVAATLAYRGHGDRTGNVILSISASAWLISVSIIRPDVLYFLLVASAVFAIDVVMGALSDLRAVIFPKTGIGVLFGTFNPVHLSHLRLLKQAMERRQLQKIYVHATTVPKLHRLGLRNGEIEITRHCGMREYRKTGRADPNKNYFPTGNRFYEYAVRRELLIAALRDAGLENSVEVLNFPEIYEESGFFGVLRLIKLQHRGTPIHGLHGSDTGGMWIRSIFDHSGWIYPCPFVRSDHVSATAIRNGAVGLTSATVERFLSAARTGQDFIFTTGYVFHGSGEPIADGK